MADLIAPELGFNVYNLRATILEVPPGYDQGSYHSHGEGVKHYLKGEGGIEVIGDKEYSVKTGDTVFIPADTWHGTRNTGTDPILILVASYSELGVPLIRRVVRRNR